MKRARRVEAIRVGLAGDTTRAGTYVHRSAVIYVGAWLKTEMADDDTAATGRDGKEPQGK